MTLTGMFIIKNNEPALWHRPVILATQEAETRRVTSSKPTYIKAPWANQQDSASKVKVKIRAEHTAQLHSICLAFLRP